MAQLRPIQTNFTGGELSPKLVGRVDAAKYNNGCKQLDNFLVMPHGGIRRRPGSKFVWQAKNHGEAAILRRFQYNAEQAYVLLFGPSYIRFFTPGGGLVTQAAQNITGITRANPAVVTYDGSDTFANGDRVVIASVAGMVEVNNREFKVANVNTAANTFELQDSAGANVDSSSYTAYTSGGTVAEILEVATTYAEADLTSLRFAQSNDVLYIFHKTYPTKKLVRSSALVWTLSTVDFLRGPWRGLNVDQSITLKANDKSGAGITVEASANLFDALHVGAKFKLHTPARGNGETIVGGSNTTAVNSGDYFSSDLRIYEVTSASGTTGANYMPPPTHLTGTVTLFQQGAASGDRADFKFVHQSFGIITITARASATSVTATVYSGYGYLELPLQLVDHNMSGGMAANARYKEPTKFWQEGAWSDYRGYPAVGTIFEQRLMAANNGSQTQTVWGSVTGNFEDYEEGSDDDRAVNYTIGSEEADVIRWMVPGKQLFIGTISGEYVLAANNQTSAVTPSNVRVTRETKFGSSKVEAVRVGTSVIYVQRFGDPDNYGRKIREMGYDFNTDAFQSAELTIWSEHITGVGVTGLCYAAEPDGLLLAPRTDGYLAGCTLQHEHQVVAWHRHFLGGYSNADATSPPIIESIDVVPGTNGDEIWMLCKRYVNGGVVRYIEFLSYYDDNTDKEDHLFLDSAISYAGASTTTITGLHHLRGESVYVLGNGAKQGPFTVTALGKITLSSAITEGFIGYRYKSAVRTMDLEVPLRDGTSQTTAKKISKFHLRLHRSLGGLFSHAATGTLDPILYRRPEDDMGSSPPLFTGDVLLPWPSGWSREATIYVETQDPYPMTILAIAPEVTAKG